MKRASYWASFHAEFLWLYSSLLMPLEGSGILVGFCAHCNSVLREAEAKSDTPSGRCQGKAAQQSRRQEHSRTVDALLPSWEAEASTVPACFPLRDKPSYCKLPARLWAFTTQGWIQGRATVGHTKDLSASLPMFPSQGGTCTPK